jgi:hypothetical protein
MNVVIGCDPDSVAHGVAVYRDRKLENLAMMSRHDLVLLAMKEPCVLSLENVLHSNAVFTKNAQKNKEAHAKVALSVGRCQQALTELMRDLDKIGAAYVLHKPSANWKKEKELFERMTGWKGKSNEDTRSAAYFGFLAVKL